MSYTGLLAPIRAGRPIENIVDDDRWVEAMLEVEVGLATAQARLGIIPDTARVDIESAARGNHFDSQRLALAARGAANPVVAFVDELTAAVHAINPTSANYVHRGCTSQDILDTAAMLITGRALALIIDDLDTTAAALAHLARKHRTTPAAARTLAMHAVPTTFGAKCAVWLSGVLDARTRCITVQHSLPVQLGGAAGTLASYLEAAEQAPTRMPHPSVLWVNLTDAFAEAVELKAPMMPWHTARTPIADIAAALTITGGVLGKMAVDILSMARTEVAEIVEPAEPGRGASSTMPQKRNPAMSTLIRSATTQLPLHTAMLFQSMIAEDERPAGAWHTEWEPLRTALALVGAATDTAAELTQGLQPDTKKMATNLAMTGGQIVTERLSAVLATSVGKKRAKQLLTEAAFAADAGDVTLHQVLLVQPELRDHLTPQRLQELLDPTNYIGAAPFIADRVLERFANSTLPRPDRATALLSAAGQPG